MPRNPDPKGKIAKAKAKMPAACSVRKSKFCDEIISLRLSGQSYRKIEDWLRGKGAEHAIPAATLCRNLMTGLGNTQDFMPVYEEVAEQNGFDITIDPGRSLAGQALIQRQRIDYMIRNESLKQRASPGYSNSKIRQEMETYLQLVKAAAEYELAKDGEEKDVTKGNSDLSQEAEDALAELILSGEITVPGSPKKPRLTVVGG